MTRYTEFRSRGLEILFFFFFFYDSLENTGPPRNNRSRVFCRAFDRAVKEKKSFTRVVVTLVPCETNYPFILSFCSIYL